MIYEIIISPLADAELYESALWYNEQKEHLGIEFIEEVEIALNLLKSNPFLCAVVHADFRMALMKRFPFEIFYSIDDNRILIHHIFHSSRNPKIWKNK
ncbi:MAG: type II toxin-antitoxin system RelE/ParE family toxin [Bacteroidota bacterium]|nr:type II toxin-antitoxin system RelE/ParE family toxin [Bacteroidota bacterium]